MADRFRIEFFPDTQRGFCGYITDTQNDRHYGFTGLPENDERSAMAGLVEQLQSDPGIIELFEPDSEDDPFYEQISGKL